MELCLQRNSTEAKKEIKVKKYNIRAYNNNYHDFKHLVPWVKIATEHFMKVSRGYEK